MKDYLGVELAIGDEVVLTQPRYRNLVKATIVKFTPQKVRVKYRAGGRDYEYLSEPDFLVSTKNLHTGGGVIHTTATTLFDISPSVGDTVYCYNGVHTGTPFVIEKTWKTWGGAPDRWWKTEGVS